MTEKNHNSLGSILKSLHIIRKQNNKHDDHEQLSNIVLSAMDENTRQHCIVVGIKGNTLLLSASSPAWQHNIRFFQSEILTKLQNFSSFSHVNEVKTRINKFHGQDLVRKSDNKIPTPSINPDNARILKDVAESISNSKLSEALRRLASKAIKKD